MAASAIVSMVIAVASMAYQSHQKRKAEKKAKKEADARKGFEISVEGESLALPVVYGRAKIAGARVYHNTRGSYTHATPPAGSFQSNMGGSKSPGKNSILYVQQALCQGNLHKICDITIDGLEKTDGKIAGPGFRVNVFPKGGQVDPMIAANFAVRSNALFTDTPYLSMAFVLNRDDPQYGGVPEVAAFVEGAEVRTIGLSNGVYSLSTGRVYTTNPAWCLLDYLLSKEYGRGLDISQIDMASFYKGAAVCAKIVDNVTVKARTFKTQGITSRDVPLYECNMVVDTARSVRENIIDILTTMGDADLVWSAGKYKLQLQYPEGLGDVVVAGVLSDDDLARSNITVKYPSASERINLCTIKFADESNDFKENSVTWPPKGSDLHTTMLAEDNNVPLEKTYSEAGIVDYSHALAKAEELCRVSRTSVTYDFSIMLSGIFYEPGDILRVNSDVATITDEYLKIQEISVTDESIANVKAVKFDPAQLAWNAKDTEIVPPRNNYDFSLTPVDGNTIVFTMHPAGSVQQSLGKLSWAQTDDSPLSYLVDVRAIGTTEYTSLGMTNTTSMEIYSLKAGVYEFAVRAIYSRGRRAAAGISGPISINAIPAPTNVQFTPKVTAQLNKSGTVTWDAVNDIRVSYYRIYVYKVGDIDADFNPIFAAVGTTTKTSFVVPDLETTNVIIGVTAATDRGAESAYGLSGTITIAYPTPPTPTGLTLAIAGDQSDSVKVTWARPALRADDSNYNDHRVAMVYRRRQATPANAWTYIGESSVESFMDRPNEYGVIEYTVAFLSTRGKLGAQVAAKSVTFALVDQEDLTPPPAPFGLVATPMFGGVFLEWSIPAYTLGRGHGNTLIYAAQWVTGQPQPSFQATNLVASEQMADMHFFQANLGQRWVFWVKEMSKDGGVSTAFSGPVVATIGLVGNADLADAIIESRNIAANSISNQQLIPGLEGIVYYTGAALPTTNISNTISWNNKLYRWVGTAYEAVLKTADLVGTIVTAQIADAALTTAKFAAGLEPITVISASTLPTVKSTTTILFQGNLYKWSGTAYVATVLAPGAVVQQTIADGAINTAKFASGIEPIAVIESGSLPTVKSTSQIMYMGKLYKWTGTAYSVEILGTNAVTADSLAANSVTAAKIVAGTITATQIATDAITAVKIAAGSITTNKIAAGAVTANEIAANTITAGQIAANSINAGHIISGAVSTDELAAGAITTAKIAAGAVTANEIAASAITAIKISAGAISSDKIAANAVTAAAIAAGAITADKLAAGIIVAGSAAIANAAIGTAMIADANITTAKIANLAVTTAKIANLAVTAAQIANATITNAEIANLTVTAAKIADANITTAKIANLAVTTAKIANLAVTSAQIADANITNAKIANAAITTLKIGDDQITVPRFLQYDSTLNHNVPISLTFVAPDAMFFEFSFRYKYATSGMSVAITLDGAALASQTVIDKYVTSNGARNRSFTLSKQLAAGSHTLTFSGQAQFNTGPALEGVYMTVIGCAR